MGHTFPEGWWAASIAGPRAVVGHDLVVARRSPEGLLVAGATLLMPTLLGSLTGWGIVLAAGWLLSGLAAVAPSTVNARRDRDLPALRRLLNLSGPAPVSAADGPRGQLGYRRGRPAHGPDSWRGGLGLAALITGVPAAMTLPQVIISVVGVVAFVLLAGRGDGRR